MAFLSTYILIYPQIGAYLEIDLGQVYDVESVKIFSRPTFEDRLLDSTVTLRSASDEVLAIYEIGDATSLPTIIDIPASHFSTTTDVSKREKFPSPIFHILIEC